MMTSFIQFQRLFVVILLTALLIAAVVSVECAAGSYNQRNFSGQVIQYEQKENKRDKPKFIWPGKQQHVQVVATGYTAGIESTGKKPGHPQYGITYSGVKVRRALISTVAADPKVFPIGTLLYIPGYGYGVVADTGSAIRGNKIDLYFETRKQVFKQWGKRQVVVEVLRKGDGKLTEAWLEALNNAVTTEKSIPEDFLKF